MDEEEIINLDKEIEEEIRNMSERNINRLFDTISQSLVYDDPVSYNGFYSSIILSFFP